MQPTPKQQQVLDAGENLLVVGRPGSGKTTVALWKARQFIEKCPLHPFQRVLFLSFSNAAVERIMDAAKGKGGLPQRIRRALRVRTFHFLCVEILRPHAHLVGVSYPFRILPPHQRQAFAKGLPKEVSDEMREAQISLHFQRLEAEEGWVLFDRFAPLALEVLRLHADLREAYSRLYPLILVDEYQDTDDHQDELVRLIGSGSQLICLGDDDQQIYDWRADISPQRLQDLTEKHSHTRIELEIVNHRSAGSGVLEYARAVLTGRMESPVPASVDIRRYPPRRGKEQYVYVAEVRRAVGRFYEFARGQEWAAWRNPSLAIMMRTNSGVSFLSRSLKQPNKAGKTIPHTVVGSYDLVPAAWSIFFATLECRATERGLSGFDRVLEELLGFESILPNGGSQARKKQLAAWLENVKRERPIRGYGKQLQEDARALSCSWTGDPIVDFGRVLGSISGIGSSYQNQANLSALVDALEFANPSDELSDLVSPLADQFAKGMAYTGAAIMGKRLAIERQLRGGKKRIQHGTVLLTLHKCKGKEFDGVILVEEPFSNRFVPEGAGRREIEQSRRLLHTAISRARQWVCVITPSHDPCTLLPGLS